MTTAAIARLDGTCNCLALRKASRYLTAAYDHALAPVGLRATQFTILQKLAGQGMVTITQLAEIIAMDRTTLATNLKPLVRDDLVTIEPSATDGRKRMVEITAEGLKRFEQGLPLWVEVQGEFEGNFGSTEAAELRKLLRLVLDTGFDPWAP